MAALLFLLPAPATTSTTLVEALSSSTLNLVGGWVLSSSPDSEGVGVGVRGTWFSWSLLMVRAAWWLATLTLSLSWRAGPGRRRRLGVGGAGGAAGAAAGRRGVSWGPREVVKARVV